MKQMVDGRITAGSDGSVNDRKGGHAFFIMDHEFKIVIWGNVMTIRNPSDMLLPRIEHCGGLVILLLLKAIQVLICDDPIWIY